MEPQREGPLLLRPAEVARMINVSTRQVYVMIARGDLPSVRLGGTRGERRALRVPRERLLWWLAYWSNRNRGGHSESI